MYRMPEFEYVKARSLAEALELLDKLEGAKPLAGGTDLLVDVKIGRLKPRYVVDIGGLKELKYLRDTGESLEIGALTTIQEVLDSPLVEQKARLLWLAAREFAYWQVRNMATIGGNLCNASPAADMAPPLLVYEALLKIASSRGERLVPITEFFLGPRQTVLQKGELLVEVVVPYKKLEGAGFYYAKIGRRLGHDISVVAVAAAVKLEEGVVADARVALNSVAPRPIRAYSVEKALIGREPSVEVIEEVAELVERDISPISDVRAPAEYRLYMSKLLVREALLEASKSAWRGGVE
ncbi:MAG: FAD binding domain-containing protein [Desulfurococcaceae archaeon]